MVDAMVNTPRVQLVCRAGVRVGLGHLIRTREVVRALDGQARSEIVIIGEAVLARTLLGQRGGWTTVTSDRQAFERIRSFDPRLVVFDLLDFDEQLLRSIVTRRRTASISPVFSGLADMDAVFTRAPLPGDVTARLAKPQVYDGPRYATIGPHVRRIGGREYRENLAADALAVAISMGGADAANNTLRIVEAIRAVRARLVLWVLLGEGYAHSYQALVDCVGRDRHHEIILAKTRDSMWRILRACSVVISAGGITTFEAAYAGLPSIVVLQREQDRFLIDPLCVAGAAVHAGAPPDKEALQSVVRTVERLSGDRQRLVNMHHAAKGLLDDQGARRIAERLMALCAGCDSRRVAACG